MNHIKTGYKRVIYSFIIIFGLLLLSIFLSGCASTEDLQTPRFTPPISDYRHGDKAIVNTRGSQYDGFFDGKTVIVVGIKDSIVECEYVHSDHVDTLRLAPRDLIEEREK